MDPPSKPAQSTAHSNRRTRHAPLHLPGPVRSPRPATRQQSGILEALTDRSKGWRVMLDQMRSEESAAWQYVAHLREAAFVDRSVRPSPLQLRSAGLVDR